MSQASSAEPTSADTDQVIAQVLMNVAQHARIVGMASKLGIDPAQLFNVAINVLEWALSEREQGRVVAGLNEQTGEYVELELDNRPPSGTVVN